MILNYKELRRRLGISLTDLVSVLGVNQPTISALETGRKDTTQRHIDLLVAKYGDIVLRYVYEGESSSICPVCADRIEDAEVIEEIPYTPKDVVESREIDLQKAVEGRSERVEHKNLIDLLQPFDYIQPVISAAMAPFFKVGDLLFLRFLPKDAELIDGEVYSIDTMKYGCILQRVKLEGEGLYRLKATNTGFDDILIHSEEIRSVALVIHLLRTGFSPAYDLADTFNASAQNMNRILDAQDKLIEEIRAQNEEVREQNRRNHELVEHIINHLK